MARPHHADPSRQDTVVRADSTVATVEQELPDLLSQPRALGGAERSSTTLRGAEEPGGQQFLISDMPERHRGAPRPGGVRIARGTGRSEKLHQPEPTKTNTAAIEHRDAELVDQVDQGERGHAAQERQPEELHYPGQQRRFRDLCDVPPQQVIEITRMPQATKAARTTCAGTASRTRRLQITRQPRPEQRTARLLVM